jgi:hypothetical protein
MSTVRSRGQETAVEDTAAGKALADAMVICEL